MRWFPGRSFGLIALVAVLVMIGAPILDSDALGQEEQAAAQSTAPETAPALESTTVPQVEQQPELSNADEVISENVDEPAADTVDPAPDLVELEPAIQETQPETAPEEESALPIAETATEIPTEDRGPPTETSVPTETPTEIVAAAEATSTSTTTLTSGLLEEIGATSDTGACEFSDENWMFSISNSVSSLKNPETIIVNFVGDGGNVVGAFASSEDGGVFTSFYLWKFNLSDTLVSATADVDSLIDFDFVFMQGPSCQPEATETVTSTIPAATSTSTPTETATFTPTATPETQTTIDAEIDFGNCEFSDENWMFSIANPDSQALNPEEITVHFAGGPSVQAPVFASSEAGGVFTKIYFWKFDLTATLESATAKVTIGIDYDFVFLQGPPCGEAPVSTPTETGTPTETPSATASSTPTETATATVTATASSTPSETATATPISTPVDTAIPTNTPVNTETATPTSTASATPSSTASATPSSTANATPSSTTTATATATPTGTTTATATATPTHPVYPPKWPTHTPVAPLPLSPTPPVGGLPGTGAGPSGSSGGIYGLLAIVVTAGLGLGIRRRNNPPASH